MSDLTELRKALKLKDSDPMHGDSLLLHAAQRIRELESINAVLVEAAHAALDFGLDQRSKRGGWARRKIEAALAKARGEQ